MCLCCDGNNIQDIRTVVPPTAVVTKAIAGLEVQCNKYSCKVRMGQYIMHANTNIFTHYECSHTDTFSQYRASDCKEVSGTPTWEATVEGGCRLVIPSGDGVAMKTDLNFPWNKLRTVRR